jgi:hypothetical protein
VNKIRWFTRRITGIILLMMIGLVIPCILAKIGQVFGLWVYYTTAHPAILSVILYLVTRIVFICAWVILSALLIYIGQKQGFFWFRHDPFEYFYEDDEDEDDEDDFVDKSPDIVIATFLFIVVCIITEIEIAMWT